MFSCCDWASPSGKPAGGWLSNPGCYPGLKSQKPFQGFGAPACCTIESETLSRFRHSCLLHYHATPTIMWSSTEDTLKGYQPRKPRVTPWVLVLLYVFHIIALKGRKQNNYLIKVSLSSTIIYCNFLLHFPIALLGFTNPTLYTIIIILIL